MKGKRFILMAAVLAVGGWIGPGMARAGFTPVAQSDWTGSRSTTNGITGTAGWSEASGGFRLSWVIEEYSATELKYSYTLTNNVKDTSGNYGAISKDLSHLILGLSEDLKSLTLLDGTDQLKTEFKDYGPADSSNPGIPGDIYGVKFEEGTGDFEPSADNPTISFVTKRIPVWGSFYAVDGKKPGEITYAFNTGFTATSTFLLTDAADQDLLRWIAVPDTEDYTSVVPEPGTLLGAVLCAVPLGILARRRQLSRTA